jgi:hypothetical protein
MTTLTTLTPSRTAVDGLSLTLRIFIGGRERIALPYAPEENDAVARLLQEYWPRLLGYGRLGVFVEEHPPGGGTVLHFIKGAR